MPVSVFHGCSTSVVTCFSTCIIEDYFTVDLLSCLTFVYMLLYLICLLS